ncbi:hypothetical protein [Natronosalvus rutilus]|uniref:Uncharacterized protein n=1 Tax=Natronosalvus rutilus TaxID=2953753 RepID=A0A9E7SW95_9EURY|nr:hypothetical protein [Natronosalvus rutilus]UTF53816.1 hypothetical protein NGM29_00590 [Natronosalvus rutilus]
MVLAGLRQLNVYGKVATGSACLGLIVLLVGGPPYPYEAVVLFGIAALTVGLAMYRGSGSDDDDEYAPDSPPTRSNRQKEREKKVEADKVRAINEGDL